MTDLSQQTEQLVLWLKMVNHTLENIGLTLSIVGVLEIALLIIIAVRCGWRKTK